MQWASGSGRLRAELGAQRAGVERLEADPAGDLLARGLRALVEELAEVVAGLLARPPLVADLALEVRAQLRRADPGAQVVGRGEAGVHVGQGALAAVRDPG